jgi:CubicO group peptidase (beta-lactamase class C family)
MFMLSSYIISHYTGSYTAFVKDRIFSPLNMNSTTFSPSEAVRSGEMTQAWTKSGRRIPQWSTDELMELIAGPGGIISSGEDMVRDTFDVINQEPTR